MNIKKTITLLLLGVILSITACRKKDTSSNESVKTQKEISSQKKIKEKIVKKIVKEKDLTTIINDFKLSNYDKTFKEFKKECENKNGKACALLAISYQKGLGTEPDSDKYKWLLEEGCKLKNGFACNKLAYYYRWEKNDKVKAKTLFEESNQLLNSECDKNDPESCLELALNYKYAFEVEKNLDKAVELTKKSYKFKGIYAPNSLGYLYKKSIGVKEDLSKANMLFIEGCENNGDATACFNIAYDYENAIGVDKNEDKATIFYDKGCKSGSPGGCIRAGKSYYKSAKYESAFKLFERGISLGNKKAHYYLGQFYEKGLSVKKDIEKAKEIYEKGCEKKDGFSCYKLAVLNIKKEDIPVNPEERGKFSPTKAIKYLRYSCKKKDGEACYILGSIDKDNIETYLGSDYLGWIDYSIKGCKYENANSCIAAAETTNVSFKKYRYYKKACKLDKELCSYMEKYEPTVKGVFKEHLKQCGIAFNNRSTQIYNEKIDNCLKLAEGYYNGYGIKRDRKSGNKVYKLLIDKFTTRCNKGNAISCRYLGYLYKYGKGVRRSRTKSKEFFKKSKKLFENDCLRCVRNSRCKDRETCVEVGKMYEKGIGTRKDSKLSKKFYEYFCATDDCLDGVTESKFIDYE